MPKYFDIHSHLTDSKYDTDRDEVIERLRETETHTITIGTDLETSKRAVELAEKHEEIYACIGVHPVDDPEVEFDEEEFEKLVGHPKVVCIGECGMDFFHAKREGDYERQKELFIKQIHFAAKHDKPIQIHARSARLPEPEVSNNGGQAREPNGADAYDEILGVLESLKPEFGDKLRGNAHFFAGSVEQAKRFLDLGFTMSFTGVVTFTEDYDEVIKFLPLESIMVETDAPYVAPVPHRGERNEPSYVSEVVKKIAEIRGEDEEVVRKALINNVGRVFSI